MPRHFLIWIALLASAAHAQDATKQQAPTVAKQQADKVVKQDKSAKLAAAAAKGETQSETQNGIKTLSGISILGNQEAPKSLVIVPWKSSEIGDMPGLSRLLDDSVQPVDKEVFMRELDYFQIRSSPQ